MSLVGYLNRRIKLGNYLAVYVGLHDSCSQVIVYAVHFIYFV